MLIALVGRTCIEEVLGLCGVDFGCIRIFLLKRYVILNGVAASALQNCKALLYIKN
jgi:hypothetical protein